MVLHTLSGAVGTGIVIIAYVPQFVRIARTRRAADVSIPTYLLWAAGSALLLIHAMGMGVRGLHGFHNIPNHRLSADRRPRLVVQGATPGEVKYTQKRASGSAASWWPRCK